jgi:hypothetical protein
MTIKDNPYFTIVEPESAQTSPVPADQILSGNAWSVCLRGGKYHLEYLSGEHAGREKSIVISQMEFEQLRDGELTVDNILSAHGAF